MEKGNQKTPVTLSPNVFRTQIITIREQGSQQATILYASDTLTGGAGVLGFSVQVNEVLGE